MVTQKNKTKSFVLSLIVPMHNEEPSMDAFFDAVTPILTELNPNYEIIAVDDGSTDQTLAMLKAYREKDPRIKIISLSRNFGKEAAMTAGLFKAIGDAVIPIDADLQDPPELIKRFVEEWHNGYKVVIATRNKRDESFFKRKTAEAFYKVLGSMTKIHIPANTGDYRLMDRQVVEAVKQLPERTRFMKGIFAWAGFPTACIHFDRPNRVQGTTNWNFPKLWSFALDGIFSFTNLPLKIWTYIGLLVSSCAFLYGAYIIIKTLMFGVDQPGYASLVTIILFLSGIQLISLGVIGEYIARIYKETKQRPLYIVNEEHGLDHDE